MALSSTERNAFIKASKLRGWERVRRMEYGRYLVQSASSERAYVVTGTERMGRDHTCSCEAAVHGRFCWHKAAVVMARQRYEWQKARAAQGAAQVAPVAHAAASVQRRAVATIRINGTEYAGEGRNVLDAVGNSRPVAVAA